MKSIVLFAAVLRIILITAIISFTIIANAQSVAVNTTGNSADASAMLDISSNSKGFLPPRMTTTQRTGIVSPANGLMVFDTDTKTYWYFSTAWKEINNAGVGSFSLPYSGNSVSVTSVFSIINPSLTLGSSAIYGRNGSGGSGFIPLYSMGLWGDNSTGVGVAGSSNTIGVLGITNGNDVNGIGIKGISSSTNFISGAVTGINNASGVGVYGTSTGANGIGVSGVSNTQADVSERGAVTGKNSGSGIGVYGESLSGGTGIKGVTSSPGYSGVQGINNGGGYAVIGESNGSSPNGIIGIANPINGTLGIGVEGISNGNGDGVKGMGGGSGNGISGIATFNSSGNGVYGEVNSGTGNAVKGVSDNSSAAVLGVNSHGHGVAGTSNSIGHGVYGTAGVIGAGIYGRSNPINSTGRAALFEVQSSQNTYDAVVVNNAGLAGTLNLKSTNSNNDVTMVRVTKSGIGDYMVFENGIGDNKIRFGTSGVGYFNGGTQNSGADIAEAFDVTGNRNEYEAGDVLIISTDKDRAVEKSSHAYSTLVAGVYATKPGVLLTEEDIETDITDKVPMGVIGVIPTKVCLEGGEIKRGDLLVTSSIPGLAMKADIEKIKPGQVIGKALENFNSPISGKIRVLVNVK